MARARFVAARPRETSTIASGPDGARWETTSMATRPAARPGPRSPASSRGLLPRDDLAATPHHSGVGSWAVAKKPTSTIPAAKLALYEKLIATDPSIERKGATIPYTSANGKMFTYLS